MADATEFWTSGDEQHQQIAREYYEGIEIEHPSAVTSDRLAPYSEYGIWNTTAVVYPSYSGSRVSRLGA